MSLERSLKEHILADAAVSALVGDRYYPMEAPTGITMPYVVYQVISASREHHYGAASGLALKNVQLSVWDSSNTGAEAVSDALRLALDGFTGDLGAATTYVNTCHLLSAIDQWSVTADGDAQGDYGRILEFEIWYGETIPTF